MSTTINTVITYADATTTTPYGIEASTEVNPSRCYRDAFTLSPSVATEIFKVSTLADLHYASIKYIFIWNTGAATCYVSLISGSAGYIIEIPAGQVWDGFGKDIYNSESGAAPDTLDTIEAKGNTTIEIDVLV